MRNSPTPIIFRLGLLLMLNLALGFKVTGQAPCSEIKNTTRPFKFWSYEGDPVLKSKQLKVDMTAMKDEQVNNLVSSSRSLKVMGYVFGIPGGGMLGYSLGYLASGGEFNNVTLGLFIGGAAGVGIAIVSGIVAQSHYKKGLLRYNEVCELRMGASSNGIGVGLYLTLK
jgi:hypothetical protein